MKIEKRILVAASVRKPPTSGWSWIDRRFLREYAAALERDAVFFYLFLAAVSDKHGLSYWSESAIAARLRLEERAVSRARDELQAHDLVSYEPPLYQVLSLPELTSMRSDSEPNLIGDILRELSERTSNTPRRRRAPLDRSEERKRHAQRRRSR